MGKNKIVFYGKTLIDLTDKSVTPEVLHKGETAKNAAGEDIVGAFTIEDEMSTQENLITQIKSALAAKA